MTELEQKAFVQAYDNTVCNVERKRVEEFVRLYYSNESVDHFPSYEYTSIVDALQIWQQACKWQLQFMKSAWQTT